MSRQARARVRFILLTLVAVIKTLISLIPARLLGNILIPYAEQERGYSGAYGSEWILIIGSFLVVYYVLTKLFERWLSIPSKEVKKNENIRFSCW